MCKCYIRNYMQQYNLYMLLYLINSMITSNLIRSNHDNIDKINALKMYTKLLLLYTYLVQSKWYQLALATFLEFFSLPANFSTLQISPPTHNKDEKRMMTLKSLVVS